ncbi:MAG: hypothetical protein RLZ51_1958 [Pseudomonadota bacterium]
MIPQAGTYLDRLATELGGPVASRLPTAYEQAGMLREPMHLRAVRVEFERAAARRVDENSAIRALLKRGAHLPGLGLAHKQVWTEAAATQDADLSVSALQAGNDVLRGLLVEMHAVLEAMTQDAQAAPQAAPSSEEVTVLLEAVWLELRRSTERRRLPSDRF